MFWVDVMPAAGAAGAAVLRLRGQLDHESAVQLSEAAEAALSQGPAPDLVVVDCATLEFCDSSGIGELVRLYQRLSGLGGRLRLAAVPTSVTRVFELTGLDQAISLHPSTAEALAVGPGRHDSVTGNRAGALVQKERGI